MRNVSERNQECERSRAKKYVKEPTKYRSLHQITQDLPGASLYSADLEPRHKLDKLTKYPLPRETQPVKLLKNENLTYKN